MTTDAFLGLLNAVRKTRQGWIARCPAHPDVHPSLGVAEGDKGILVKCWTGCRPEQICAAVGLRMSDLFYEKLMDHRRWVHAKREHAQQKAEHQAHQDVIGLTIDCAREAQRLIDRARGIDISGWNADRLHAVLNLLADAYEIVERDTDEITTGL